MINKTIWIVLAFSASGALACLRTTPDKRAIQWSDAIVHAKLAIIVDAQGELYDFEVTDSIDGKLKAGQKVVVHHITANISERCGVHLASEDLNKNFLLLLRGAAPDAYVIVNVSPAESSDPSAADAFKQLVEETRKAEAALTDDAIRTQALAYANAQDDTEADQAEAALTTMGYKAAPIIRQVMKDSTEIGKQRLGTLLKDLTPPNETEAASNPSTQPG